MNQWQCSSCGYTFEAEVLPNQCPSCKQVCSFNNVTCYIPDCGGPGNIDPQLAAGKSERIKKNE